MSRAFEVVNVGGQGHVVEGDAWGSATSCRGCGALIALGLGFGCVACSQQEEQVRIQASEGIS